MAFCFEPQGPGQEEGPGEVGGVGDQKEPSPEVGFQEEEVFVGGLAFRLAEEAFPGHPVGQEVAAPHLPLAEPVPWGLSPGHGDPGGEALPVEGQGRLEAPLQGGGRAAAVLGRPQDHDPGVALLGQGQGEEGEEGEDPHALHSTLGGFLVY